MSGGSLQAMQVPAVQQGRVRSRQSGSRAGACSFVFPFPEDRQCIESRNELDHI